MGKKFVPPSTIYILDFEGTELEGLEVRMRGGKLGAAFDIAPLVGKVGGGVENLSEEDARAALAQYEDMAAHLVSWNMADDNGNDIPATIAGLKTQEIRHVNMIAEAWQRAQVDVPGPLPSSSHNGPPPDLPTIPMMEIPASLAS